MKIPFDIKFRPQIESGEYKVETRGGMTARIICWDRKNNDYPIIALLEEQFGKEYITSYTQNGQRTKGVSNVPSDLFIVTPEPELTEFELALDGVIRSYRCDSEQDENGILSYQDWIKRKAKNLLELAKKEICKDCNANLEGYARGKLDVLYEISGVYKHEGLTIPAFCPPCHYGGECINPFHDCLNCPRGATTVGINTITGTSTAKAEGK